MNGERQYRDFNIAVELGEARENAFLEAIRRTDAEHKSDEKARKTGNLFIEYRQGNPPRLSGISTTRSDFYVIEYDDECWLVLRTRLVKELAKRAIREKRTVTAGDNFNVGALVPLSWVLRPWDAITEQRKAA